MIRSFATALLLSTVLGGCGIVNVRGSVEVRLENGSSFTFDEATFYAGGDSTTHTSVGPGQATSYVVVETAYRIATTQVVIGSDTLRLQVIDFVGEEPLEAGRYTYVILVVADQGRPMDLTQELRVDP
jgi:hypothetical protein